MVNTQQRLRSLMSSIMVNRFQFFKRAGISFGGKRDLYEALGYQRDLTAEDYRDRYARGGIAGRIVDVYPKATWRQGAEILDDENPDTTTQFEKAWLALNTRLKIWSIFQRLDTLVAQGYYGVLLLGAPGDFSSPLVKGKETDLIYLSPFAETDASVESYNEDTTQSRFGFPERYMLKRTDLKAAGLAKPVHWSRVLHVAENVTDTDILGQPRLERVWNLLDDLDKVTGGGAEAFWLRANQGMHVDIDKDMDFAGSSDAGDAEKAALEAEVDDFEHSMRRTLRTRGVKVKMLGSDVADFGGPANQILQQIAGSIGIPVRLLVGSERGELASTQDRDNWNSQVADRRTSFAEPCIVRPFVDRCIEYGYLPEPSNGEYTVRWPPKQDLTETEQTDLAEKKAKINDHFAGKIVVQPNEVREAMGLEAIEELDFDPDEVSDDQVNQLTAALRKAGSITLVTK